MSYSDMRRGSLADALSQAQDSFKLAPTEGIIAQNDYLTGIMSADELNCSWCVRNLASIEFNWRSPGSENIASPFIVCLAPADCRLSSSEMFAHRSHSKSVSFSLISLPPVSHVPRPLGRSSGTRRYNETPTTPGDDALDRRHLFARPAPN